MAGSKTRSPLALKPNTSLLLLGPPTNAARLIGPLPEDLVTKNLSVNNYALTED